MMAAYHTQQSTELDSSHNTSSTSLVPVVPYPTAQHHLQVPSPIPQVPSLPQHAQPSYELIPHRIFVGGFPSATTENELRTFFEKYGHIREAKVIRSTEGSSKGYGFVTFDTEEEAQTVRNLSPDQLEFKGRRLNLGPAMRRVTHSARFTDFAVASPTQVLLAPQYGSYYHTAYPQTPTYVVVQPGGQTPSFFYSPVSPPNVQQQLQQPTEARYVVQQNASSPYTHTPKRQTAERTSDSIDDNRAQSSPKQQPVYQQQQQQQTLQLPQSYYTPQPLTPVTPNMQRQPYRHMHQVQMQNYGASQGSPYAHQPTMSYYATQSPADMTHYSQM